MKSLLGSFAILTVVFLLRAGAQKPAFSDDDEVIHPSPFPVEITKALDVKKLKVGDEVPGVLERDALQAGRLVAAAGSMIQGHITEILVVSSGRPASRMQITFDKIVTKDGREFHLRLPTIIQALAPDKHDLSRRNVYATGSVIMTGDASTGGSLEPASEGSKRSSAARVLTSEARGVIYLQDLTLEGSPNGTVIVGNHKDVKLGYGTQVLIGMAPSR